MKNRNRPQKKLSTPDKIPEAVHTNCMNNKFINFQQDKKEKEKNFHISTKQMKSESCE